MANTQLTIRDYMSAPQVQKKMADMFTSKKLLDGFVQSVIAIAGSDELLATAEPRSVFNACLTAASLGLPINKNLGFAHIIGYQNNKKGITEAQFQLGARGFKELAQRSGQYLIINQGDVREGELDGRDRLTGELNFKWCENDAERAELPIIGYFSYFRLANKFSNTLYMSIDEVRAHGLRYSQSFQRGYGPWKDNFEAMALKTVMKLNISKNGPLSVDPVMQQAIEADQAIIGENGERDYIDGTDMVSVTDSADASEDAILKANGVAPAGVNPETGEITENLDDMEAAGAKTVSQPAQTAPMDPERTETGKRPNRVKEELARRKAAKESDGQATLVDDNAS